MKRILRIAVLITAVSFTSCIKEEIKSYTGNPVLEFDAAVLNAATVPFTYYVTARNSPYGLATTTANSTAITRLQTAPVKLRVNLVGPQSSTDQVLSYVVSTTAAPVAPNLLAVSGTHFTTSGTFTIPANNSFGEVIINIVNPGVSSTSPREVHLEITGNSSLSPSVNYSKIGVRIAQN